MSKSCANVPLCLSQTLRWDDVPGDTSYRKLKYLMSKTSLRLFGLYLVAVCADLARTEKEAGGYVRVFGSKKPAVCDKLIKEASQLRVSLSSCPSRLRLLRLSRVSLRGVSRVPLGCLSCMCLLGVPLRCLPCLARVCNMCSTQANSRPPSRRRTPSWSRTRGGSCPSGGR